MAENTFRMDYIDNKYSKWYFSIVRNAQIRESIDGYYEKHHIIPRSLNGTDEDTNLVQLTFREHFLVHWLLTKMLDGEAKRKMCFALHMMRRRKDTKIISSWQYAVMNEAVRHGSIGRKRPDLAARNKLGRSQESIAKSIATRRSYTNSDNPNFGKKHTEDAIQRMKSNRTGKGRTPKSEETKQRMREARLKYWADKRASGGS